MTFLARQLEDPGGVARLRRWFYVALAAIVVAEIVAPLLFEAEEAHFWFEELPAFGALYGLVASVLIIVVSKLLKSVLLRREDYYDS